MFIIQHRRHAKHQPPPLVISMFYDTVSARLTLEGALTRYYTA
jgi:hypothetical protein